MTLVLVVAAHVGSKRLRARQVRLPASEPTTGANARAARSTAHPRGTTLPSEGFERESLTGPNGGYQALSIEGYDAAAAALDT